jgi:hypothetical protein
MTGARDQNTNIDQMINYNNLADVPLKVAVPFLSYLNYFLNTIFKDMTLSNGDEIQAINLGNFLGNFIDTGINIVVNSYGDNESLKTCAQVNSFTYVKSRTDERRSQLPVDHPLSFGLEKFMQAYSKSPSCTFFKTAALLKCNNITFSPNTLASYRKLA